MAEAVECFNQRKWRNEFEAQRHFLRDTCVERDTEAGLEEFDEQLKCGGLCASGWGLDENVGFGGFCKMDDVELLFGWFPFTDVFLLRWYHCILPREVVKVVISSRIFARFCPERRKPSARMWSSFPRAR